MVLPTSSVDNDVIEINEEHAFADKDGKDGVFHALECVACIRQAKRHAGEVEQPTSCAECGLVGVRRLYKGICQYPEAKSRKVK